MMQCKRINSSFHHCQTYIVFFPFLAAMVTRQSRRNRKRSTALADFYTSPDAHAPNPSAQPSPGAGLHTRISQPSPASARRKIDRMKWVRRRRRQQTQRNLSTQFQVDEASPEARDSQPHDPLPRVTPHGHDAGSRSSSCRFCKAKLWKAEEGLGMLCCR